MNKILVECLLLVLALAIANYGYQGATAHDWSVATERTWFQLVAVALLGFRLRNWREIKES